MARAPEIIEFAKKFGYVVLTIEDLVAYRQKTSLLIKILRKQKCG